MGDEAAKKWDGLPQNPDQDGWHWLRFKRGKCLMPFRWNVDEKEWEFDADYDIEDVVRSFQYIAPCPMPDIPTRLKGDAGAGEGT